MHEGSSRTVFLIIFSFTGVQRKLDMNKQVSQIDILYLNVMCFQAQGILFLTIL